GSPLRRGHAPLRASKRTTDRLPCECRTSCRLPEERALALGVLDALPIKPAQRRRALVAVLPDKPRHRHEGTYFVSDFPAPHWHAARHDPDARERLARELAPSLHAFQKRQAQKESDLAGRERQCLLHKLRGEFEWRVGNDVGSYRLLREQKIAANLTEAPVDQFMRDDIMPRIYQDTRNVPLAASWLTNLTVKRFHRKQRLRRAGVGWIEVV